jgi:hypothetical protein
MLNRFFDKIPMAVLQLLSIQGIIWIVDLNYPKVTENIPTVLLMLPSILFAVGVLIFSIWILIVWYFTKDLLK